MGDWGMQGQDLRVLGVQCQGHCIVYRMGAKEGTSMYKLLMICLFRVIPFFTSQRDDDGGMQDLVVLVSVDPGQKVKTHLCLRVRT